jgi:hypothetical protein
MQPSAALRLDAHPVVISFESMPLRGARRVFPALFVVALAAPACSLIAGLSDYHAKGATGGSGGQGGSGGLGGGGGHGGTGGGPTGPRLTVGRVNACYLTNDRHLECWGDNESGQLATASGDSIAPVPTLVDGVAGVDRVALGYGHTCALMTDRSVVCWGDGQAGATGTTSMDGKPKAVAGLQANAITAGDRFTCAASATDGLVYCWGSNDGGSLGRSFTGSTSTPKPIDAPAPGAPLTGVTALASTSGRSLACALAGARLVCWGGGSSVPREIPNDGTITDLAVGAANGFELVFARTQSGEVLYTYRDSAGAFAALAPYPDATGIQQIAAGDHLCVLDGTGALRCTYGFEDATNLPPLNNPDDDAPAGLVEIGAGQGFDCVRAAAGVSCIGLNTLGQVGNGRPGTVVTATKIASGVGTVFPGAVCTTLEHTDATLAAFGQCSVYPNGPYYTPTALSFLHDQVHFVRTGIASPDCGDCTDRRGYFYGEVGGFFELQDGSKVTVTDIPAATDYVDLTLDERWGAALHAGGQLDLFALDDDVSANGLFGSQPVAKGTHTLSGSYAGFSAGPWARHLCAWTQSGTLSCWGANDAAQADPTATGTSDVTAPHALVLDNVTQAVVGRGHTCAIAGTQLLCWGQAAFGELGGGVAGAGPGGTTSIALGTAQPATRLASGGAFTCAYVDADEKVYCWGANGDGECGNGHLGHSATPGPVKGLSGPVKQLTAGTGFACALLTSGDLYCWGSSYGSRVGNGTSLGGWMTPAL